MADRFDVQHRDVFESLAACAGAADLVLTSPPYPDARSDAQYGGATFDTTLEGYHQLGLAVFEALKPGGVCAMVIDGPIREWRTPGPMEPQHDEPVGKTHAHSERSLIAFKVAIDWAERIGFRYLDHVAYGRDGCPLSGDGCNPRWRSGWEPAHVFAKPGARPYFARHGYTVPSRHPGKINSNGGNRKKGGKPGNNRQTRQGDTRCLRSMERWNVNHATTDREHPAPFSSDFADAMVLCYCPEDGLVCDPLVGSGTVALSCHRHGRRFVGGDIGHRERDGRRWADIVNEQLAQGTLF